MINSAFSMANALLGWLVRRQGRVTVAPGCIVRWWGLRGARKGGTIEIGQDCIVRCRIDFDSPSGRVVIGQRCYLGASRLVCHSGITIGDDVIMAWGITIVDHDSHSLDWPRRKEDVANWKKGVKLWDAVTIKPVVISDKVWIGFGASLMKGITLGEGAVIGANSVVTRDVLPYTVVAGNPARIIRRLDEAPREE